MYNGPAGESAFEDPSTLASTARPAPTPACSWRDLEGGVKDRCVQGYLGHKNPFPRRTLQ